MKSPRKQRVNAMPARPCKRLAKSLRAERLSSRLFSYKRGDVRTTFSKDLIRRTEYFFVRSLEPAARYLYATYVLRFFLWLQDHRIARKHVATQVIVAYLSHLADDHRKPKPLSFSAIKHHANALRHYTIRRRNFDFSKDPLYLAMLAGLRRKLPGKKRTEPFPLKNSSD